MTDDRLRSLQSKLQHCQACLHDSTKARDLLADALKMVARKPNCWCPQAVDLAYQGEKHLLHTEACDFTFRVLHGHDRGE